MAELGNDDDTLISQDDIDNLLNSASLDGEDSLFDSRQDDQPDGLDDEMGELSQDDIDSLLNMSSLDSESSQEDELSGLIEDDDYEDDDLELVSQEDIDLFMKRDLPKESDVTGGTVRTDGLSAPGTDQISHEVSEKQSPDPRSESSLGGEIVIDESQAVSIEDNLVTQETIDRLLAEVPQPESAPDPESILQQVSTPEPGPSYKIEPDPTPDMPSDRLPEFEPDPASDMAHGPSPETFARDDIDTIAQEDIDDLLRDDPPDNDFDGDSYGDDLISQEDIDELLKISEEEDEDIIGNLDNGLGMEASLDQEEDDHQVLLEEGDHQVVLEEDDHQVLLEEAQKDLPQSAQTSPDPPVSADKWYRSRRIMAACLAAVVVLAALPLVYFGMFAEKKPEPSSITRVDEISKPEVSEVSTIQPDPAEKDPAGENPVPGSGNIVLENFVMLVPGGKTGLSYVTASLSINYSDIRAADEINNHLPLYRDIIFDAMDKVLASQKIDKITEADLLANIKDALNLNLSGSYVEQVSFSAFSTG